jgi:hypothetical protein
MIARAIPALALVGLLTGASSASEEGTICVAPLPDHAESSDHDTGDGKPQRREPAYEFTVEFDRGEAIPIAKGQPARLVTGLQLGESHLVVIRDAGVVIESFRFTFESRGDSRLCLTYTPWYQTWQLDPPRPGASWCRCEDNRK